jgi:tetratricopeptide (TPR) repeat protein
MALMASDAEGNRLLAAGMPAEALKAFQSALASTPGDVKCLLGLAKAHMALEARDAALATLEQLLKVKPDHLEARSHRALLKYAAGDKAALAELEAVARDRHSGFAEHFNYGQYLLSAGKHADAQRELTMAQRIESRDPRPHLLLAALAQQRGDPQGAISALQQATQLVGPTIAAPWVALGRIYRAMGRGREAAQAYHEAVQRRADDGAAAEEAYRACAEAGAWDLALKVVLALRQKKPDDQKYAAWQQEVNQALKSGGAPRKVSAAYEEGDARAIDVDRELIKVNEILGRNPPTPPHVAKECITKLEQVLRIQPSHGDALNLMGLCKFLAGSYPWKEAEDYGKKAQAAAVAAKNPIWKQNADALLRNLSRKRVNAEKKAAAAKK